MAEIKSPLPFTQEDLEYLEEHQGELYGWLDQDAHQPTPAVETDTTGGDYDTLEKKK
jgi:hypothetical protein